MHRSMNDLRKRNGMLPDRNTMIELNLSIAGSECTAVGTGKEKKRIDPSGQEGINEDIYLLQAMKERNHQVHE
jgi:hypothetical protein